MLEAQKKSADAIHSCFEDVFRTQTSKPGFCLLDLGPNVSSFRLREVMVMMKKNLSSLTKAQWGKSLRYEWLGRFDQQVDTKYHRDNAPNQSFLMLGYEPTDIESKLYIADYVQFSLDRGIAPAHFFERYHPMYTDLEDLLKPYVSQVKPFDKESFKIILINNSSGQAPCDTLGVLHRAQMVNPDLQKSRVVNSMMISMGSESRRLDKKAEKNFLITTDVSS
ncbi:MAG: hypothetical protein GVX96_00520 [Bacteroidetes bacterium]|jgi:hypothetical protein|nr:hypothetical protein [Bacteroidota bacterium]